MSVVTYALKNGAVLDLSRQEGLRALDCEIARRNGYTGIEPYQYWTESYHDTYEVQTFRSDDGRLVPEYTTDANDALSLLPPRDKYTVIIRVEPREFHVEMFRTHKPQTPQEWSELPALAWGKAPTLPLAICFAYLVYLDQKEAA